MYLPSAFRVGDPVEMVAFIQKNTFGQLISQVEGRFLYTYSFSRLIHVALYSNIWILFLIISNEQT